MDALALNEMQRLKWLSRTPRPRRNHPSHLERVRKQNVTWIVWMEILIRVQAQLAGLQVRIEVLRAVFDARKFLRFYFYRVSCTAQRTEELSARRRTGCAPDFE